MGHTGGLTNPRPWWGRCRAGFANTGGSSLLQKRAHCKKIDQKAQFLENILYIIGIKHIQEYLLEMDTISSIINIIYSQKKCILSS